MKRKFLVKSDYDLAKNDLLVEKEMPTHLLKAKLNRGVNVRSQLAIAMRETNGNVAESCERVGVSRKTYWYHLNKYPEFKERIDHILDARIDFAEKALFEQIANGNTSATQFYLKTQGAKRGYTEKTEHKETREINVNFSYETVKSEKLEQVQEAMEAQVIEQQRKMEDGEL